MGCILLCLFIVHLLFTSPGAFMTGTMAFRMTLKTCGLLCWIDYRVRNNLYFKVDITAPETTTNFGDAVSIFLIQS